MSIKKFNEYFTINEDGDGGASGGAAASPSGGISTPSSSIAIGPGTGGPSTTGGSSAGYANVNASNVAGMGNITAANPSCNPGALNGPNWSNGGGTVGSGDIGVVLGDRRKKKKFVYTKNAANLSNDSAGNKKMNKYAVAAKMPKVIKFSDFVKSDIKDVKG